MPYTENKFIILWVSFRHPQQGGKVVTSRCVGSKISGKVRRHIGKQEDPGEEVEMEVLSAAISTAFFRVKKKTGNCIFFMPRFEVLYTLLSCQTNSKLKGISKKKINNPLINEMNV